MDHSSIETLLKMQWPSGLKEECWLERERPGYWKRFIQDADASRDHGVAVRAEGASVFYCLYHEDHAKIQVIDFVSSNESVLCREPPSFRAAVAAYPLFSWASFLSFFRIHQCLVWDAINNIDSQFVSVEAVLQHPWHPVPVVRHILEESFGVLLWQHQFESIFRLVEHGRSSEIMKFYRDCQQGKPGMEELLSRRIDGDTFFGEILDERMIFGGVGHRDTMIREMALLASSLLLESNANHPYA